MNNLLNSSSTQHWEDSEWPDRGMISINKNKTYMWCWWRLCRAPWSEEGQACPWGTPSATRLRHGRCAPRPAARQCRDQTPRGATKRKEWKRATQKHTCHWTMGNIHALTHFLTLTPKWFRRVLLVDNSQTCRKCIVGGNEVYGLFIHFQSGV